MSPSDLNFDIRYRSLRSMRGVIVMGDTMYRNVNISWGDIHLILGIRTLWARVVHERSVEDYSH